MEVKESQPLSQFLVRSATLPLHPAVPGVLQLWSWLLAQSGTRGTGGRWARWTHPGDRWGQGTGRPLRGVKQGGVELHLPLGLLSPWV